MRSVRTNVIVAATFAVIGAVGELSITTMAHSSVTAQAPDLSESCEQRVAILQQLVENLKAQIEVLKRQKQQ